MRHVNPSRQFGPMIVAFTCLFGLSLPCFGQSPELVSVKKIWDKAPHNAFTDLVRFQDKFFCVFRESDTHAKGQDGKLRILESSDGDNWSSAALLAEDGIDLRDPKLSVTSDGRLMLVAGGSIYEGRQFITRRPRVAFSKDGHDWTLTQPVLAEDHWLWQVTWNKGRAYGTSRACTGAACERLYLYTGVDGLHWNWVTQLNAEGVNEATIRFDRNDQMIVLARSEAGTGCAWVGRSQPPYKEWQWQRTGLRFGGPNFIQLPDGRFVAAGRLYEKSLLDPKITAVRTSLCWLDVQKGTLTECLALPSGGDTSYPGMVWHDGFLWVSYYSAHEGSSSRDTAIYIAKVRFSPKRD